MRDELLGDETALREFLRDQAAEMEKLDEENPMHVERDFLGELHLSPSSARNVAMLPGDLGYCRGPNCRRQNRVRFATVPGWKDDEHYCEGCAHDLAAEGIRQAKQRRRARSAGATMAIPKSRKRRG